MLGNKEHGVEELLTPSEREELGEPQDFHEMPEAEVVEWEDGTVVATPGYSIASSMDRFMAGNLSDLGQETFDGFHSEFSDNGEYVMFLKEDLQDKVGDKAVVKVPGINKTLPVDVRSPEEALEVVRNYDHKYIGDVEDEFWEKIRMRNAVVPVMYNDSGVIPETQMALMESDGIITSNEGLSSEDLLEESELDSDEETDIQIERYEAPEEADGEYFVEVLPPQGSDTLEYETTKQTFAVSIDGQAALQDMPGEFEVIDESENNGLYRFELQ